MEENKFKSLFAEVYSELYKEAAPCMDSVLQGRLKALLIEKARENKDVRGLGYLPWVGRNYSAGDITNKVFLIAESHYIGNDNWNYFDCTCVRAAEFVLNRDLNGNQHTDANITYSNLFKTINPFLNLKAELATNDNDKRLAQKKHVFTHSVFMNLCQRCMKKGERPGKADFINGWHTWVKVVELLKPTLCICDGVSSADEFSEAMTQIQKLAAEQNRANIRHTIIKGELINGAIVRKALLQIGDHPIEIVWIKHTAKYFTAKLWRDYLENRYSSVRNPKNNPFRDWVNELKAGFEKEK